MGIDELSQLLGSIPGVTVRTGEPLRRHMPLRVGGPADVWALVADEDALLATLKAARQTNVTWSVHWPFQDWLVRDGGMRGLVIRPGRGFEAVVDETDHVQVGAAALWSALPQQPKTTWWSELSRWPGTIGAALANTPPPTLKGICTGVRVCHGGRIRTIDSDGALYDLPKNAVVTAIRLAKAQRLATRGAPPPSAGTLFDHPEGLPVGPELERAGLSGTRLRDWRLSTKAPGTLINRGHGSCKDVLLLARGVCTRMEKVRGLRLVTRIPVKGVDRTGRSR